MGYFIWSAKLNTRKLDIVSWNKFCYQTLLNLAWYLVMGRKPIFIYFLNKKTNFFNHNGSWTPLIHLTNIPYHIHKFSNSNVCNYLIGWQWHIPIELKHAYPQSSSLPLDVRKEKFICNLSLKEACIFHRHVRNVVSWLKSIWNNGTPP